MSTMIQIRNVPEELHRRLAALAGTTLSDYLLKDIGAVAEGPTTEGMRVNLPLMVSRPCAARCRPATARGSRSSD